MHIRAVFLALSAVILSGMAQADDLPRLTIKDHKFQPERLAIDVVSVG